MGLVGIGSLLSMNLGTLQPRVSVESHAGLHTHMFTIPMDQTTCTDYRN